MTALDIALLAIRMFLGITFILHGGQKLFGWYGGPRISGVTGMMRGMGVAHPSHLAWAASLSEFVGGVLVLVGFFTPFAAAIIMSAMITAIITVHLKKGFFNTAGGYEFNLSLIVLAFVLMLLGAGMVSVDYALGFAATMDQMPTWLIVILLVIPFAGILATEYSRRAAQNANNTENMRGV